MLTAMKLGLYPWWFEVAAAVFVTCLITANIIAEKLICMFELVIPASGS
jgi:hypothetical protein